MSQPKSIESFEPITLKLSESTIHAQVGSTPNKPVLVLLHGFPQTHAMWWRVAQALSAHYRIVLPDLRGYGQSYAHQPDAPDHSPHSKRAMANDVVALLNHLGIDKAYVCGHDRVRLMLAKLGQPPQFAQSVLRRHRFSQCHVVPIHTQQ